MINNYTHPTRTELLVIFSLKEEEAMHMRIKYLQTKIQEHEENLNKFVSLRLSTKTDQLWFVDDYIGEQKKQINKHAGAVSFIKRRISEIKQAPNGVGPTYRSYDKEDAKTKTCREVLEEHGISVTPRGQFKIRDERTPSCSLYNNDTRWKDFGSGEGGDVIDLYMQINGCDFPTACKDLSTVY